MMKYIQNSQSLLKTLQQKVLLKDKVKRKMSVSRCQTLGQILKCWINLSDDARFIIHVVDSGISGSCKIHVKYRPLISKHVLEWICISN